MMSRRPINPSRRVADNGASLLEGSIRSKTRSPPYLTVGLVIVVLIPDSDANSYLVVIILDASGLTLENY